MQLGLVYARNGFSQDAAEFFKQSLTICEEVGDFEGQAVCLGNLGQEYVSRGGINPQQELQLALEAHSQALAIREKICDTVGAAECHEKLGYVCHSLGQFDDAVDHYIAALRARQDTGMQKEEAYVHKQLGAV